MHLAAKKEVLDLQSADHTDGVTFSSTGYLASTVTLNYVRWLDMGQPRKIVVEVTLPHEKVCTCGPGKELVCHSWGSEPHYAGCPRWGTPIDPGRC